MGVATDVLNDALRNRGTAFTLEERDRFGLVGRLPPRVEAIDEQVARVLATVRAQASPMAQFANLAAGRIFPPAARLREVAAAVAVAVARTAYADDFATRAQPPDVAAHVRAGMYRAEYR